jgi:hypothetical protein
MPWSAADAKRHDKKAASGKKSRQWSDVANSVLERTGDEGEAVREANGVVKRQQAEMKSFRGSAASYKHSRPKRKVVKRSF